MHFVILGLLAAAIFLFAAHESSLRESFYRIATDIQDGVGGGPVSNSHVGLVHELDKLFSLRGGTLHRVAAAIAAYAVLEGVEAVGLWFQRRWAEYLTFIATTLLLPLEVHEIVVKGSWFKVARLRREPRDRRLPALRQAALRPPGRREGGRGRARAATWAGTRWSARRRRRWPYPELMASQRQISVGGVPIGGGAPVAVQTMTKTETANLQATMDQIRRVAEAGADVVRVAVPRDDDVEALKTIVVESPIPVIADIHFNHTLALKALDAGAHCVRINPGNIGGPDKVGRGRRSAREPSARRCGSGSTPARCPSTCTSSSARTRSRRW